jgi:hypothetical protein
MAAACAHGVKPRVRLPVLAAALLCLAACSPVARLELRFAYAGAPLDPALFQLTGKKTCPPGPVATAPPASPLATTTATARSDDTEWQQVHVEAPGLRVVTAFRGSRCRVRVTAFYDTNRDGRVNAGDLSAMSPAIDVVDNGIFGGNLTAGPVLKLAPIP